MSDDRPTFAESDGKPTFAVSDGKPTFLGGNWVFKIACFQREREKSIPLDHNRGLSRRCLTPLPPSGFYSGVTELLISVMVTNKCYNHISQ